MDNITNHPLYHPGEGPSIHVLSSEQRRYLAEQAASIERHYPKAQRQYVDYDPDEYGEHEGRRERRHAALSILSDQEALLEQALDNNETLAQTRYRLMHSILCVRYTERLAIRYTGSEHPLGYTLNTDKKNLRYTFVSHPMSIKYPSLEGQTQPSSPSSDSTSADSQRHSQTQPRRRTYQQKYPEINMVDDRFTDWWGYNDGIFSKSAAVRGGGARRESGGNNSGGVNVSHSSPRSTRRKSGGGGSSPGGSRTPTRTTPSRGTPTRTRR